jgi:excisionase family DNA binding protein
MKDFVTTEELAERLRTSPSTVRYWRHIGYGPPSFKVGRRVLYNREGVERWINQAQRQTR